MRVQFPLAPHSGMSLTSFSKLKGVLKENSILFKFDWVVSSMIPRFYLRTVDAGIS
jgi:hypothetical protein